jgi:hypothetical protein
MKVYVVMKMDSKLKLVGKNDISVECNLPNGHFIIHCFTDLEKAEKFAGDEYEITVMETVK